MREIIFRKEEELPDEAVEDAAKGQIEGELAALAPTESGANGKGGNGQG